LAMPQGRQQGQAKHRGQGSPGESSNTQQHEATGGTTRQQLLLCRVADLISWWVAFGTHDGLPVGLRVISDGLPVETAHNGLVLSVAWVLLLVGKQQGQAKHRPYSRASEAWGSTPHAGVLHPRHHAHLEGVHQLPACLRAHDRWQHSSKRPTSRQQHCMGVHCLTDARCFHSCSWAGFRVDHGVAVTAVTCWRGADICLTGGEG
jgi:hypothetical protein